MRKLVLLAVALPFALCGAQVDFPFQSRIFFSAAVNGNTDIFMITANRLQRITDHPAEDEWPVVDLTGERMVFQSRRTGNLNIFMMDLASKKLRQLTFDRRNKYSPSFSPDGRFVLFDLEIRGGRFQTMKLDLQSGKIVPLFPGSPFSTTIVAFYHPDGNQIFFTAKVFLGWKVARYRELEKDYLEITGRGNCRPKISPDGKKVAYVSFEDDGLGDICLVDPDGRGRRNLTAARDKHYDYYPCFSPDGKWLVFSSSPKEKEKNGYQLFIMSPAGGEIRQILKIDANCQFPFWSRQ